MAETGVVESLSHGQGYGWIIRGTRRCSPVFFHLNQCPDAEDLTQGDRVTFDTMHSVDRTERVQNVRVKTWTLNRTREAPQEADGAGSDVAALGSSLCSSRGSSRGSSSCWSRSESLGPHKRSPVKETFPRITVNFSLEINKVVVREFRLDVRASELVSSVKSTINELMRDSWKMLTLERWIELKLAFGADGDLDDERPLCFYQIGAYDIVRVFCRSPSTNVVMLLEPPARATQFFFDAPRILYLVEGLYLAP